MVGFVYRRQRGGRRILSDDLDERRTVAVDGDDDAAAALAAADLGVSMGNGADVAIGTAGPLRSVVTCDRDGRHQAVRRGLARSMGACLRPRLQRPAVPAAAFVLFNPLISGAAMAFSSAFEVSNSLPLCCFAAALH